MNRLTLSAPLALVLALAPLCAAQAQTTTEAAKADGKAFGKDIGAAAQSAATTQPSADRVPGFGGTPSQSGYFDDPKAMERAAASQASSNTGYAAMRDSMDRRATFNKVDLDAAIARSKTISEDPLAYTSGMGLGGTQGRCVPLPPSSGTAARYKATCNTGYTVESGTQSCTVTLQASVTTVTDYVYECTDTYGECDVFQVPTCQHTGSRPSKCLQGIDTLYGYKCFEPGDPIDIYTCSAPVTGLTPKRVSTRQVVNTTKDESQCAGLAADTKDAVVALNAMDQARREFDPDNLTLFKGTRESCSSKVFGILNCCKGKGFPLIPGIQLLVALGCSREEMLLHQKDAQGLCAYVGTYCSSSFLGVCLTKRKVYCCFESKLSRILQEQGRQQLGKPWASPKTEQCAGFTIDEFARLDLSRMDFSEVYAEFTDAARLPDELQAATQIQQKIEAYYANTRP